MCIIIIANKKPDALIDIGINNSADMIENEGDAKFLRRIVDAVSFIPENRCVEFVVLKYLPSSAGVIMIV